MFAVTVALFLFSACGGGGAPLEPPTVDITGNWSVTETITESSGVCDPPGTTSNWSARAVQNGNDVTVTTTSGAITGTVFTGTVSGNKLNWTGSYPDSGGTVTVESSDVTATDTSLSGTTNWSWSDGKDSCTGKTEITGNKT
jgi:hypothetical protein